MIAVLIYIYHYLCITAPFDPTPNGGDFGVGGSLVDSEEDGLDEGAIAGIVIGSIVGFIILVPILIFVIFCCVGCCCILCENEDAGYVNAIVYPVWLDNQYNYAVHTYIICMIALYM